MTDQTMLAEKPLDTKSGMFSRWLFALLEQIACGVLMLFHTLEREVDIGTYHYEEPLSVLTVLDGSEWHMPYLIVMVLFFTATAMMAVPLVVDRFRKIRVLIVMLIAQVVFAATNITALVVLKSLIDQQTVLGIPFECNLTVLGCIYLVVTAFATLELVMTMIAVRKRQKLAAEATNAAPVPSEETGASEE